jgi:hypothetical protein
MNNTEEGFGFGPGIEVVFSHFEPDGTKVYITNIMPVIAAHAEEKENAAQEG